VCTDRPAPVSGMVASASRISNGSAQRAVRPLAPAQPRGGRARLWVWIPARAAAPANVPAGAAGDRAARAVTLGTGLGAAGQTAAARSRRHRCQTRGSACRPSTRAGCSRCTTDGRVGSLLHGLLVSHPRSGARPPRRGPALGGSARGPRRRHAQRTASGCGSGPRGGGQVCLSPTRLRGGAGGERGNQTPSRDARGALSASAAGHGWCLCPAGGCPHLVGTAPAAPLGTGVVAGRCGELPCVRYVLAGRRVPLTWHRAQPCLLRGARAGATRTSALAPTAATGCRRGGWRMLRGWGSVVCLNRRPALGGASDVEPLSM